MTNKQRETLSTSFRELGNLIIAALVIGQVFSTQKSFLAFLLGFSVYVILNTLAVILVGGEEDD